MLNITPNMYASNQKRAYRTSKLNMCAEFVLKTFIPYVHNISICFQGLPKKLEQGDKNNSLASTLICSK